MISDPHLSARPDNDVQSSLSTKISVIVFWFMIVAGMGISFSLLHNSEARITTDYAGRANGLAYDLESFLHNQIVLSGERIEQELQGLILQYRVEAIEISLNGKSYLHGQRRPDQVLFARSFDFHPSGDKSAHRAGMSYFSFTPLHEAVAQERKQVLIYMGIVLLSFGLSLHWVLRRILTQPFQRMVQTAKSITHDETALRFPEDRTDEFGFLARFINKALDFITLKQGELREALDKVRLSEASLRAEKTLIEVTLHSIGDAVITTDAAGNIQYLNPMAEKLTGWKIDSVRGKPVRQVMQLIDEEHRRPVENPVEACLRDGHVTGSVEHVVLVRPDGSEVDVVNTAAPIRSDEGGPLIGTVLVIHDVSRAQRMAKQLAHQASHDDLTGLANRREFERILTKAVNSADPGVNEHTLCYMDLDQFKIVNDTCGHIAGDELLRQFASILRSRIRETDTVARLGGDEFGILFQHCDVDVAKRIAENLLQRVKEFRFVWKEYAFDVGVSIGLVSISSSQQSVTDIMSAADVACYAAKEAGRHRVHVFRLDDDELKQRHGEMRWVSRLNKALEEDRFRLYCQRIAPVADVNQGNPHYELLIRLLDEEGKLVPPLAFIPAAERYNLMTSIDRWVVRKAFEAFSANAGSVSGWRFSINLSGQSLCDETFMKFVIDAFGQTGVSPEQICFEITETTAVANLTQATRFIAVLKGMGCRFSLDDFGTGLSSFGYLQTLKVDYLKIDGSFVRDMTSNPVNRAVVEAANQIGHAMGMQTIAEFVENGEILRVLGEIGVNYAQGYGVAKPAPMEEIFAAANQAVQRRSTGT
ncbi:diguanylate cyclase [Sulfuricaulis limicola]|uniref:Diguanylate cyclase n=1 Tax=Sulfuricaulis limicola TaxID=1620215 RepID=A0A1B4XHK2_9GAMM|nr:EAL domain-containing protein [Sulfuricaulis limicola]BAV34275.1 diguanylate cyclase [Sulfuricaulis limicola]